jgi:hypothetical protein
MHFTAYVCVMPTKPHEPIGPNKRRFPKVHNELFLSKSDAAEWAYFENADEPAPDAVGWVVVPVQVPALTDYLGDTPFVPADASETAAPTPA